MSADTMVMRTSLAAKKQKEIINSMAMQTIVQPMELGLFDLQLQLTDFLSGKKAKQRSKKELAMELANDTIETQQEFLTQLFLAMYLTEMKVEKGNHTDG